MPYARSRMASAVAGTALRSIYCWRSEDEIKMGPNFNQLNDQSKWLRELYPKYGGDFQTTADCIISTRKRKIRLALENHRVYAHEDCLPPLFLAQKCSGLCKNSKKKVNREK